MSESEQPQGGEPPRIELDPHPEPERPAYNPYQAPMAQRLEPPPAAWEPGEDRPVPWEDEAALPGIGERWWATVRLAYTDPGELSARVPATQPMLPAWTFFLVTGLPATILSLVVQELTRQLMSSFLHLPLKQDPAVQMVGAIIGLLAGPFIGGAFLHCFLWMWGGAKEGLGLHQTIRFLGYAYGAYYLVGWIPLLNIPLGIAFWVFLSMGLARTHRTDTWRGFAATLTPVLVCCCIGFGAALVIPALLRH